jgi:hypothetical protein
MSIFAYTRIKSNAVIHNRYDVPPDGLSGLSRGQEVGAREIIASADVASEFRLIDIADILGVPTEEASEYLQVMLNEPLSQGDVIASRSRRLGRITINAPIDGRISRIENGVAILEGETKTQEVLAKAPGVVTEIDQRSYVVVETVGTVLEAAWGMGKSTWGIIKTMDTTPSIETDAERITPEASGAVLVIGSPITAELLEAALTYSIRGIVASSIPIPLVSRVQNDASLPIVVTQGFGEIPMSTSVLTLLNTFNGREAALNLDNSTNWREIHPEIIIPVAAQSAKQPVQPQTSYKRGDKARVLQQPHLGEIGTIQALPEAAQQLESGLWVYGAMVEMPEGDVIFAPFANLEALE